MWAGQFGCEALNWVLKHIIKEERPHGTCLITSPGTRTGSASLSLGSHLHLNGYGFPSSHSQYMGYFGAFLICHIYFRHRFASCGYPLLDRAFRWMVYLGIVAWVALVAYSRSVGINTMVLWNEHERYSR